jgi:hypothetical protein
MPVAVLQLPNRGHAGLCKYCFCDLSQLARLRTEGPGLCITCRETQVSLSTPHVAKIYITRRTVSSDAQRII